MEPMHAGAIPQRDGKTFAIVTRIPGGFVTAGDLERIAATACRHAIPRIKITSGQRILLAGMREQQIAAVMEDLHRTGERETGPCVRYVQACLGTEYCRYGIQDAAGVGREIEEEYHRAAFPAKLKIGVSGCLRCCSESYLRDVGLIGTDHGWTVVFGGNSGRRPAIGTVMAARLSTGDALDLVRRLLEYYRSCALPGERTARFLERIGIDTLRSDLLSLLPYVSLGDLAG